MRIRNIGTPAISLCCLSFGLSTLGAFEDIGYNVWLCLDFMATEPGAQSFQNIATLVRSKLKRPFFDKLVHRYRPSHLWCSLNR